MSYIKLPVSDLPAAFTELARPTQLALIGLATTFYTELQGELRAEWETALSVDETQKADALREEGRKLGAAEMLAQLRDRLGAGEAAAVRAATLEAAAEAEVERQVLVRLDTLRKDFELQKMTEMAELRARVAAAEAREGMIEILKTSQDALRAHTATLELELAKYKTTKSSHALGKIGEAELFEMLNAYVLPRFPYAEVRDMTAVKHVADFHLWVFGPTGNRVKILLDSKKYATPVQNVEVEKLYSDVDADDEADAGILVSLDSPVAAKTQFQITRTSAGKPCLFLSFEKLDDGIRQEVLCWAIRALVSVVSVHDNVKQDSLLNDIQAFLVDVNASVSDLDGCLKICKSLSDSLRDAKERLVSRMNGFRVRSGMVSAEDIIVHEEEYPRCVAIVGKGDQCKSRRIPLGMLCSRHKAMEDGGKVIAKK